MPSMKSKIAQYLLILTLGLVAASFLPWVYMTAIYYIFRYAIMACTAAAFVLTFSLEKTLSSRFMRLFAATIALTVVEFVVFKLIGHRFHPADCTQLIIAFLCICIGQNLDKDLRFWANLSYYYTIGLILMGLLNCWYWAGGFYVPEHYMLNEGKNQVGALIAIAAGATFFLGIKLKEQRTHYLVVSFLAVLVLVLIRARSDLFALLLCMLLVLIKDANWKWQWNLKTVLTIIGIGTIAFILYTGFVGDELKTFMVGGKSSTGMEEMTSRRMSRNTEGLEFFLNDPLKGEQEEASGILLIHNYILLRLVRYGIWSFPIVAFYLYFGIHVVVALFRKRKSDLEDLGYVVATVPLLVSFVEPNFPYGPGSVQLLTFVLLGTALAPRRKTLPTSNDHEKKHVLHICNDFTYSKVHTELYQKLDQQGVSQTVYAPIRNSTDIGKNHFEGEHTNILYAPILKPWHRLFFHKKIEDTTKDIVKNIDLSRIQCTHATTLFSDGTVALELKKRFGIPYVVAVRNSDLNAFLKYAPHLWWVHREVIREADKVIFITPMLQQRLRKHWTVIGLRNLLEQKSMVIANGLNDFWLKNLCLDSHRHAAGHRAIYVGNFDNNKNVLRLMEAFLKLKNEIPDIHLDLVGGSGEQETDVLSLTEKHPDLFHYHGRIYDKQKLQSLYQSNNLFAMASIHETFGLVFVESMSQGLSVLYTRNEGIDGLFDTNIGEAVDPHSVDSIQTALRNLFLHPERYQTLPASRFQDFNWSTIAQRYQTLYENL